MKKKVQGPINSYLSYNYHHQHYFVDVHFMDPDGSLALFMFVYCVLFKKKKNSEILRLLLSSMRHFSETGLSMARFKLRFWIFGSFSKTTSCTCAHLKTLWALI